MPIVNITRATPSDERALTLTVNQRHAVMLLEMAKKTAAPGEQARTLADLHDMADEACKVFDGRLQPDIAELGSGED